MKKIKMLISIVVLLVVNCIPVFAASYESYVIDKNGNYRYSPSLYEPVARYDQNLKGVTDICVDKEDHLYAGIETKGNGQILKFSREGTLLKTIEYEDMHGVSGVFVSEVGKIYVADDKAMKIHVFDEQGAHIVSHERPKNMLYGKSTPFKPTKLVCDRQENIYVISEGVSNGIILLNVQGEFQGFYGPNRTNTTIFRQIQSELMSDEMMNFFVQMIPSSMSNIAIDDQGIVYATTYGDTKEPLKKINVAGLNLLPNVIDNAFFGEGTFLNFRSVAVDKNGNMVALSDAYGSVFLFDKRGNNLGIFGMKKSGGNNELGITTTPLDVTIDSTNRIYIADGIGIIHVFEPTPLMNGIYEALVLYNDGRYLESQQLWNDVGMRNTSIAIASKGLGHVELKKGNYREAMEYFEASNAKAEYSEAFWEVRQIFITKYVPYFIVALFIYYALRFLFYIIVRRAMGIEKKEKKKRQHNKVALQIKEVLRVLRHPRDTFYDMRFGNTLNIWTAIFLLVAAVALRLVHVYWTGFLFIDVDFGRFSPMQKIGNDVIVIGLFIISNYLVASIRDGEGSFVLVFKGVALSLTPIVLFEVVSIGLSNVLTLQEVFIYQASQWFIYLWVIILLISMIMEVHDYMFGQVIGNIALTIFVMVVIFVVAVIINILGKEFFVFFRSIFEEVMGRV